MKTKIKNMEFTTITISKEVAKKLNIIKYNQGYKSIEELLTNKILKGFCILCGSEEKLQNHHVDYDKNFIVRVCLKCHSLFDIAKKTTKVLRIVTLKCPSCDYTWISKAINPNFVTCPSCQLKVRVEEKKREGYQ